MEDRSRVVATLAELVEVLARLAWEISFPSLPGGGLGIERAPYSRRMVPVELNHNLPARSTIHRVSSAGSVPAPRMMAH